MLHNRVTLWRVFVLGRCVVTGAFLGLLLLMNGLVPPAALRPLYLLALAQFTTNGLYLYLWRRRALRPLGFLSLSLEIVLISLLMLLLGVDGYALVLAYLWPIAMGGWLLGRRAILSLAFLGLCACTALVMIAQRQWAPPQRILIATNISQALVLCLPYLASVALLVWWLTNAMERGEQHLQARNRDLHRVNFGLRYLVAASEELLSCRAPEELAALALRKVAKLTGHARGALYLRERDGFCLCAESGLAPMPSTLREAPAVPADWLDPEGGRQALAVHTIPYPTDEATDAASGDPPPSALTFVALRSGEGLEGVLAIASSESDPFDAAEERILQLLGQQLGVALENARLLADLQHERNLLSRILAHMADGVLVVGHEGRILLANAAAHALLGVHEGESLPDAIARQIAEGANGDGDGRHVVEVEGRVIGLSVATLHAGAGLPRATIYVARDVTHEAQLEQAKSDFVAYVSHELRTPLTTIKMLVRLLLMDAPEGSKQQEYLSVINAQVTRQTRLVSDLLDLTRLEAGKYPLPLEEVDPLAVIETAASVCRPLAEEKGLRLIVDCPASAPLIHANAGGLEQVLVNLLSNAIKFTDGGGRVTITCYQQPGAFAFAVEDTGIGMSPDEVGRLFDKFATVRSPRKRGEGSGLGLAISKMIVQGLGGTIEVSSRVGQGSRFVVCLPHDEADAAAPAAQEAVGAMVGQPLGG